MPKFHHITLSDGQSYQLRFSLQSLTEIETELGHSIFEPGAELFKRPGSIATMLWVGLRSRYPQFGSAAEVADRIELADLARVVKELIQAMYGTTQTSTLTSTPITPDTADTFPKSDRSAGGSEPFEQLPDSPYTLTPSGI